MLPTLSIRVLGLVPVTGFGENDAVTPVGNPETERRTEPVNAGESVTQTVLAGDVPRPAETVPALERVKVGTFTLRLTGKDSLVFPEVPTRVRLYCPGAAVLLAVNVIEGP